MSPGKMHCIKTKERQTCLHEECGQHRPDYAVKNGKKARRMEEKDSKTFIEDTYHKISRINAEIILKKYMLYRLYLHHSYNMELLIRLRKIYITYKKNY